MHAIPFNYRKSYLSVAESRRWSVDHPVGDPYGGPAYGEKRMPVAGVVMIAVGMGMEGLAAGLMIAGGALSIAGSITGNKTLSMLGAVAGFAAGGIGMFSGAEAGAAGIQGPMPDGSALVAGQDVSQAVAGTQVAGTEAANAAAASSAPDALASLSQQGITGLQNTADGMINTIGGSQLAGTDTVGQSFNSILGVDGQPISGVAPTGVADASQVAGAGQSAAPQAAQLPAGSQTPGVGEDIGKLVENMGKGGEAPKAPDPSVSGSSATTAPAGTDADFSYLDPAKRAANQDLPGAPGAGDPVTGAAGSNKGMIGEVMDKAGKVGDWMQKNDKLVNMAGKVFERLDPSDIEKAQAEYMKAKANNDDAAAEYYRAKIAEMQRQAANANARGGNALGSGNAISANGSAYTTGQTRNINQLSAGK